MENSTTTPLADYFWIAGVEHISYDDYFSHTDSIEDTIAEDGEDGTTDTSIFSSTVSGARHSRQNSGHCFSKLSCNGEGRSVDDSPQDGKTQSNRSSATIRPVVTAAANNNGQSGSSGLAGFVIPTRATQGEDFFDDFDFDQALLKFAEQREHFLDDLSFTAGATLQSRPPMINPRTEQLQGEELELTDRRSPIMKSLRGSLRRKMSFRDLNSVRKHAQAPRTASIRAAKRMSNYNSVIPPPEPLNTEPDMHPLKRRFEPILLDRYPPRDAAKDDLARRGKFPDYVPMFAFPNDIQVVSSDERPRSTWHGFTMTSDDNSKIHGITIIIWTALGPEVAEKVEKRCEQWRQRHMTNEERELAASLGLRLAAERASLSQLLAKLPTIQSGSAAREALDDQISAVEEKIALMAEMLRPLRHGAASKIDGLTAGETGLWAPRAFGVLGRDATKMGFWKEWLRAVIVPMTDGAILRVPASSPRVGRWQPLERYVVNLCTEAFSPLSSKTQVELGVRELRLYARTEAENELPGCRNTDIFALFRCLSLDNIVLLCEYALSESRIIFLSSHTGMLHLACHALVSLLYPLSWASVFIPVLPARLLSALEAPCPYIVGVEKRYERIDLPEDDYVVIDLDKDSIDATSPPPSLPRQQRRKLVSLLQLAAPHKLRFGVPSGPPPYAMESFPYDAYSAENRSFFSATTPPSLLGKWVAQNSSMFAEPLQPTAVEAPLFNAFTHAKPDQSRPDRPLTGKSGKGSPQSSVSPVSMSFPPLPITPVSRSDSGFALSTTLREKRSGHFEETKSRRSSSFGFDKHQSLHRPSLPFLNGHGPNLSISAISVDSHPSRGSYAPSTYAQSTVAASTVMPNMLIQSVQNTENTVWVEGHCYNWTSGEVASPCAICEEKSDGDGLYICSGCRCVAHGRCLGFVSLICPNAFHPDRVRAAFVRCFASLLYTYRKHLGRPSKLDKTNGLLYKFDMDGFVRNLPYDQQAYASMLKETQAFNEFIHERERNSASHPTIRLFDEIILAKKARGRPATLSAGLSRLSTIRASHGVPSYGAPSKTAKNPGYLSDTTDHIWRTASVPVPSAKFSGDYRAVVTRVPARLDPSLMKEPRAIQGFPRAEQGRTRGLVRKQVPSMFGPPTPELDVS